MKPKPQAINRPAVDNIAIVRALRDAAPYIHAHQGRIATIVLPGELLATNWLQACLADLTLLSRVAGLKFAIAFDVLPQAAALVQNVGGDARTVQPGRIPVDQTLLDCLHQAGRAARDKLEMLLARKVAGLTGIGTVTNTPIAARPAGIVAGVDTKAMGIPKPISTADSSALLNTDKAVLLPPLGIGRNGETFHLDALDVALAFATSCQAHKLIILANQTACASLDFRELTVAQAKERRAVNSFAAATALIDAGITAIDNGVERVHFINADIPGGVLLELLSPDGVAAMLGRDPFDAVRIATAADAAGIADLIAPGINNGSLLYRSMEGLAEQANQFAVVARDDALIACACLDIYGTKAEFGCLAVRPEHANQAYGQLLLDFFEERARQQGVTEMLVATTQAADWFNERGYTLAKTALLPTKRQASINERGALVLAKQLC